MEENSRIKSIILDLGGVVFENGTQTTIQLLNKKYGIDTSTLNTVFYGDLSWELRKGKLSYKEFWDSIYNQFPDLYRRFNNELEIIWHNSYSLRPSIVNMLKKLKGQYFLGTISGNIKERIQFLEDKYQFSSLFDFAIYSFDYGEDKLSDKLYKQALLELKKEGIDSEKSLYLDDNLDCLDVARKMGFNTYLYKNFDDFASNSYQYGIHLEKAII